jgi:hypothetical protein
LYSYTRGLLSRRRANQTQTCLHNDWAIIQVIDNHGKNKQTQSWLINHFPDSPLLLTNFQTKEELWSCKELKEKKIVNRGTCEIKSDKWLQLELCILSELSKFYNSTNISTLILASTCCSSTINYIFNCWFVNVKLTIWNLQYNIYCLICIWNDLYLYCLSPTSHYIYSHLGRSTSAPENVFITLYGVYV